MVLSVIDVVGREKKESGKKGKKKIDGCAWSGSNADPAKVIAEAKEIAKIGNPENPILGFYCPLHNPTTRAEHRNA